MQSSREQITDTLCAPYFHRRWNKDDIDSLRNIGFTGIVFCLREEHLSARRTSAAAMRDVVSYARENGMHTEVDLWGFGRVFGGEATSKFGPENPACFDDKKFHKLMTKGLAFAANLEPHGIFWDEAHFKDCPDCERKNETHLLTTYAQLAAEKYDLENAVCLTSSQKNLDNLDELAALPFIHQIETDPYFSTYPDTNQEIDEYVGRYSADIKSIADRHGKSSRIWVQGFSLPEGWEGIPLRAATSAQQHGIRNIGFWACHSWETSDISVDPATIAPSNNAAVLQAASDISKQLAR